MHMGKSFPFNAPGPSPFMEANADKFIIPVQPIPSIGVFVQRSFKKGINILGRGPGLDGVRRAENVAAVPAQDADQVRDFLAHVVRRAEGQGGLNADAALKAEPCAKTVF